jgi:prophage DNA circulation protein
MALAPTPLTALRPVGELGNTQILQLQSGIAWRQFLRRAKFGQAQFYVDTSVRDSARRIVQHEFPKRDVPYAEDMGRRAREFTVRGYCIAFSSDTRFPDDVLKRKNYIPARDALILALETGGPQILQLPLLGIMNAVCSRYRVTEEDKLGGYCTFDMTFNEYGQAPATGTRSSPAGVYYAATNLGNAVQTGITNGITAINSGTATSGAISI